MTLLLAFRLPRWPPSMTGASDWRHPDSSAFLDWSLPPAQVAGEAASRKRAGSRRALYEARPSTFGAIVAAEAGI